MISALPAARICLGLRPVGICLYFGHGSNSATKCPGVENIVNAEENECKVKELNQEVDDAMELEVESDKSEVSFFEQKSDISKEGLMEEISEGKDTSEAHVAEEMNADEAVTEEFNSDVGHSDSTTSVKVRTQMEFSEQIAVGKLDRGSDESDPGSSEEMNAETENCAETVIGEVTAETDHISETEDEDFTSKASKPVEAETKGLNVEMDSFVPDTLEMSTEEGKVDPRKTETNVELNKFDKTELDDNHMVVRNDGILQEVHHTSEKVEETPQSLTSETAVSELIPEDNNTSPQKLKDLDPLLMSTNDSPSGMQTRCVWSPLASPSTSILKRGLKRPQEDEISSPVHKVRRVSFADPIYQAGLADDIDRRCSIIRCHSSNSSSMVKSAKTSPTAHSKIAEMAKESVPCPTESVYPALVNCAAPVDIILPQITSNMWARGLGQLIRAKNIKTIGDLSTLTASEIKTLPIRSPKVSNVKKALRVYHEQQVKSRGLEEIPVFDISEKTINGMENKSVSPDEERLASDLIDPVALETPLSKNLVAQISALALQLDSEDLHNYSGSQLFEMHEKLGSMANCIIKNLQSRWRSPAHENSI